MSMFKVGSGIDLGNGYTKFDGKKFATRVAIEKQAAFGSKQEEIHSVVYKGIDYTVGTGKALLGDNKYNDIRYKICLLTAVALKHKQPKIHGKICLGLPITVYEKRALEISNIIKSWDVEEITVNGVNHEIHIQEVMFFVEGAYAILKEDASNILTIDIGSGTVNVIEWDKMVPIKYDTYNTSIANVYSEMAKMINLKENTNDFNSHDVEKLVLGNKQHAYINQENVDISYIYSKLDEFVSGAVAQINESKFRVNKVEKIKIFGGGSEITMDHWLQHYPKAEKVENAQFVNSEVFDAMAKMEG